MATITTQRSGSHAITKVSLAAGETQIVFVGEKAAVISCAPGSGGTMLAEATWSLGLDVEQGNAKWHSWDTGTTSVNANQYLIGATAVRFTATTQPGVGEVSA